MDVSKGIFILKSIVLCFCVWALVVVNNTAQAQFVPEPIYPHSNEITKESNIVFKWNKDVYQNLDYQIQLSTDISFTTLLFDQTIPNNFLQINGLTDFGQIHYWRVRSINGSVVSDWSSVRSFLLFTPLSIGGLSVWLDPNSGTTLNGGTVQNLNDNTANSNNAGQVSTSQRPLFVPSDSLINKKSIMRFDGVDDFLEIADNASIDFSSAFQAFVLVKPTIVAVNKTIMAKWDYQTQGSWAWQTEFATPDELMFAPCFNITDPGNQKVITTNADMQLLKPTLLTLVYNGNQSVKVKYFKNFNSLLTSTVNSIPTALPNSTATLKIGKYGGIATRYYQGDIGEILIYNNELAVSDRNLVDSYLRYKYAPPVSLGPDTIMNATSVCANIVLKAQSVYQSYVWSTGATSSSLTISSPGTYWVTTTDFLGNVSTDSVDVYPPYNINLPQTDQLCENSSQTWTPGYPGTTFNYLWHDGSTGTSFTYNQAGSYYVKITDGTGCYILSDTLEVTLDNYPSTAFLGNDTTLCSGNSVALQVGAAETVEYYWNGASASAQAPFYEVTSSQEVTLESVNSNGCVAQDTMLVTISGTAPEAAFAASTVCNEDGTVFSDLSVPAGTDPIATWLWDFGNGEQSTEQSPSYVYPDPGTYNVELFVLSDGGCGEFATGTVTVLENPTADFGFTGYCEGKTIQFSNNAVPGDAPITEYFWDFDMPWTGTYNNSTIPIPNRVFDDEGTYDVMFVVTDANNCDDTLIAPVQISNSPETSFTIANGCQGVPMNIVNNTVADAGSTYAWNFGDNTTSILPDPVKTYPNYSDYTVTLQVLGPNGCDASAQQVVTVYANPIAIMDIGPACAGSPLALSDLSDVWGSEIDSVYWLVNGQDTLFGPTALYDLQQLGQQQVEVFVISEQGCSATASEFIEVTETLSASFDAAPNIAAGGDPFTFTNTSEGVFLSQWSFGDGGASFDQNPTHTYPVPADSATYTVSLVLLNLSGCSDTVTQQMLVLRPVTDLQTEEIYYDDQNGNSVVGVRMVNTGSSVLAKVELTLETAKGVLFTEVWTGSLPAGQDSIYVFTAQPNILVSDDDSGDSFICVESKGFNLANEQEPDLSNNSTCLNIEGEQAVLLPFYPNPITDEATVELLITSPTEVGLNLTDSRGRMIREFVPSYTALSPGIYSYTISASDLLKGVYFLNLRTKDGEGRTLKVMVNE